MRRKRALSKAGVWLGAGGIALGIGVGVCLMILSRGRQLRAYGPESGGVKRVALLGDSLTMGTMSYNYVRSLARRFAGSPVIFINAGINGDLAYNARLRLQEVLECDPDIVFVLIGTNDALCALDPALSVYLKQRKKLPLEPDLDWYRENLTGIVRRLKQAGVQTVLLSLPLIGEDPESNAGLCSRAYSQVVKEVAEAEGAGYLPLNERQIEYLASRERSPRGESRETWERIAHTALQRYVLGRSWDEISARNGLVLTTDKVHQNSLGGEMIAALIAEHLDGELRTS